MIAIIMPVYNRAEQFREALKSLTIQTNKKFFTVVCDDCSTENIKEICDEFNSQLPLVYLKTDVNGGPAKARQMGLEWAYSRNIELIMFMDSDDLLFPNAVQVLSYEINHSNLDIVASGMIIEKSDGTQGIKEAKNAGTWLHGKIYRASYLQQNNIQFPSTLQTNEDLAFNLCAFWSTKKVSYINTSLYLWRNDAHSITREPGELQDKVSGEDYVKAIYYAFNFIKNNPDFSWDRFVPNLFMCYTYYQIAITKKSDNLELLDAYIVEILKWPQVIKALEVADNWQKNQSYITAFIINENKQIIGFDESFSKWYARHKEA